MDRNEKIMDEDNKVESTLYRRHNFTTDIDMIKNVPIIEYDMKEAGFNLLKWRGYFSDKQLEHLNSISKQERSEEIGKLQRGDSGLSRLLMESFVEARRMFFEANDIQDYEVISIKKDAILTIKRCRYTELNEFINFREKNAYIGYIKLMKDKEFYYDGKNSRFDIKGFSKDVVEHHNGYLFKELLMIFTKLINGYDSYIDDLMYLKHDFCAFELDKGYYKDVLFDKYIIRTFSNRLMECDDIENDMKKNCFNNNNLNFILSMLNVLL